MPDITGHAEIFQGKDELWHWRVKAPNGEIVAQGEGYTRREDALRGFQSAQITLSHPTVDAGD